MEPGKIGDLNIKIFADGADLAQIEKASINPLIKGFTTNPTLMRKAGVEDYKAFALEVLDRVPDKPVSFEVFADEFDEMESQAREIASWGENVYVKVPVTNTRGEPALRIVENLSASGVKLNVTALMTLKQVAGVTEALDQKTPAIVSVFAGRIADTGRDPVPLMASAVDILRTHPNAELLWASPRELLNLFHAEFVGCHIITITDDVLRKLHLVGRDLDDYSLDTVKMFHRDAFSAGYSIGVEDSLDDAKDASTG